MSPFQRVFTDFVLGLNSLTGYRFNLDWFFDRLLGNPDIVVVDGLGSRLKIPAGLANFIRQIEIRKETRNAQFGDCVKRWWISEDESGRRTVDMYYVFTCYNHIAEIIEDRGKYIENDSAMGGRRLRYALYLESFEMPFMTEEKKELAHIISAYTKKKTEVTQKAYDAVCAKYATKKR